MVAGGIELLILSPSMVPTGLHDDVKFSTGMRQPRRSQDRFSDGWTRLECLSINTKVRWHNMVAVVGSPEQLHIYRDHIDNTSGAMRHATVAAVVLSMAV